MSRPVLPPGAYWIGVDPATVHSAQPAVNYDRCYKTGQGPLGTPVDFPQCVEKTLFFEFPKGGWVGVRPPRPRRPTAMPPPRFVGLFPPDRIV